MCSVQDLAVEADAQWRRLANGSQGCIFGEFPGRQSLATHVEAVGFSARRPTADAARRIAIDAAEPC